MVKVTVVMSEESVKELDEYMEKGLYGSRGRTIQALLRDIKTKDQLMQEMRTLMAQVAQSVGKKK